MSAATGWRQPKLCSATLARAPSEPTAAAASSARPYTRVAGPAQVERLDRAAKTSATTAMTQAVLIPAWRSERSSAARAASTMPKSISPLTVPGPPGPALSRSSAEAVLAP